MLSCNNDREDKEYNQTLMICNSLYVEEYFDFKGGVFGGDLTTEYLTDSSNFRIYIGSLDTDNEYYRYYCYPQLVAVTINVIDQHSTTYNVKDSILYNLDSLKRLKNYK